MDSSFVVKSPRPGASKLYTSRDPVPVRETAHTELEASKTGGAAGDGNAQSGAHRHEHDPAEQRTDQAPHDVIADADSRAVIYRERDVRTATEPHPDQVLLRERAYRSLAPGESSPPAEPHA